MRKIFFSLVAAGIALTASAQQTDKQMATLQDGDRTSVYYGVDALKQACADAPDTLGVITLSAGDFNAPASLSKSVAIYGVGFERDEATGTNRTCVKGNIELKPVDTVNEDGYTVYGGKQPNGVHLEGLYVDGDVRLGNNHDVPICNLTIAKCHAGGISHYANSMDVVIRQSQIGDDIYGYNAYDNYTNFVAKNMLVTNTHLGNIHGFKTSSTIVVDHSILRANNIHGAYTYTNSVLYKTPDTGYIAYNCVFVGSNDPHQDVNGNWYGVQNAGLWAAEGEDGTYAADKDFALKYPNRYVGNDGTQVGLHGGVYAWNKIPVLPRITECTIDTSDVPNGTLKVSIKAEAQTKE